MTNLRISGLFACVFALSIVAAITAQAQAETVLYSFGAVPDAQYPVGGVIMDKTGNLYGATGGGGVSGFGAVFEVNAQGENVLYSFGGPPVDGSTPLGGLMRDTAGNLYGTTAYGGSSNVCSSGVYGCGIVFEVAPAGTETVLHRFCVQSCQDGAEPQAGLVQDANGNLYGTAVIGGQYGHGTVFEVSPGGTESVLYNFTGGADGGSPAASLLRDKKGNLYGTTLDGGIANSSC